jgi:hypothetical protein
MITTFDNKEWGEDEILPHMYDDSFYYGYLGKNALSSSAFKTILNDYDQYINSLTKEDTTSESQPLRDGRLIHLQALEPERIQNLTIIDSTKGSKLYKEAVIRLGSAEVYTQREMNKCIPLADNVRKNFEAYCLLDEATMETPGIKMIQGLPVRGKADVLRKGDDHIIDLKTTSDSSRFEQAIDHWGYDLQGALYLHLFDCTRFSFIVLDKITGSVTTRELTKKELKRGQAKLQEAIDIFKRNTKAE